jgi:hypothetical protein
MILAALLALLCIAPAQAAAAQTKTFAVLPFQVHGPQKYRYLQQGLQSMLTSRLTWENRFVPVDATNLQDTEFPGQSATKAQKALNGIGADYLVWGSATVMGDQASVDLNLLPSGGEIKTKSTRTSLDRLIPAMETMAEEINSRVFERPQQQGQARAAEERKQPEQTEAGGGSGSGSSGPLLLGDSSEGKNGTLNPSFRYERSSVTSGRWRSQSLSFDCVGMVVGDANKDGREEAFILGEHEIRAYRYKQKRLAPLGKYSLGPRIRCLNINYLDMDRDGYGEIIVSAVQGESPESFVLNFKDGKFEVVRERIDLFLNVIKTPPDFMPTLIGQRHGGSQLFHPSGVHRVVSMSGEFKLGHSLSLPTHANVFNIAYLPQQEGHKIIMADNRDRLRVYSGGGERQSKTEKAYAGTSIRLEAKSSMPGLGELPRVDAQKYYFVPSRMIPCNLDGDERFELLVNHNMSVASRFFANYRSFPQGQIRSLYWDGVGLNTAWKTPTIKGTVMDYGLGDLDNEGKRELYVCLNTHPGFSGLKNRKTIVLAYALSGGEEQGSERR